MAVVWPVGPGYERQVKTVLELSTGTHAMPSTLETEAGDLDVLGHSHSYSKFDSSLVYMRPNLNKTKRQKPKMG